MSGRANRAASSANDISITARLQILDAYEALAHAAQKKALKVIIEM